MQIFSSTANNRRTLTEPHGIANAVYILLVFPPRFPQIPSLQMLHLVTFAAAKIAVEPITWLACGISATPRVCER